MGLKAPEGSPGRFAGRLWSLGRTTPAAPAVALVEQGGGRDVPGGVKGQVQVGGGVVGEA